MPDEALDAVMERVGVEGAEVSEQPLHFADVLAGPHGVDRFELGASAKLI